MKSSRRRNNQTFIRCHDQHGRGRDLSVALDEHGKITLGLVAGDTEAVLSPLEVRRLRTVLRNAVFAADVEAASQPGSKSA
uniref:hypothetical protein n=1 Tax=Amycolatopsis sp. CA-151526 TaxID=3239921 RepID=UPI003F495798